MRGQEAANRSFWARSRPWREYDNKVLRPVEVVILARHEDAFSGRVLELGCGAGRVTWYLAELAQEVHAVDVAPAMLERCAAMAPKAIRHQLDFSDLSGFEPGSFSAIVAPCNVIDVLSDEGRRQLLRDLHDLLQPGGLLVFSSHNLGFEPNLPRPWDLPRGSVLSTGKAVALLPRRMRNHLRLRGGERRGPDFLIRNDASHDYSTLLYFIGRDAQQRQLEACGFELLECLDLDAHPVAPGDAAPDRVELHYVARRNGSDHAR